MPLRRRKHDQDDSEDHRFRKKMWEESHNSPGMMVRIERLPNGAMSHHMVEYCPAGHLDLASLELHLRDCFGVGDYVLYFVDERGHRAKEFGSLWLSVGDLYGDEPDTAMEEVESRFTRAFEELSEMLKALAQKAYDGIPGQPQARDSTLCARQMLNSIEEVNRIRGYEWWKSALDKAEAVEQTIHDRLEPLLRQLEQAQLETQREPQPDGQSTGLTRQFRRMSSW